MIDLINRNRRVQKLPPFKRALVGKNGEENLQSCPRQMSYIITFFKGAYSSELIEMILLQTKKGHTPDYYIVSKYFIISTK